MSESKLPDWLPGFVHDVGRYIAARAYQKIGGRAGTLMFFQDGMLGALRRIADGSENQRDFDQLKTLFQSSEQDVEAIMVKLSELRDGIAGHAGGAGFARETDHILYGPAGKRLIRSSIAEIMLMDPHDPTATQYAKGTINMIEDFNRKVTVLSRKALDWGKSK